MAARTSPTRIKALGSLEAFAGCTKRELAHVDALAARVEVPAGTQLLRQGRSARQCFVVEEGSVLVFHGDHAVGVVGQGSWVGELALLDGGGRRGTAVTLSPATLLVFTAGEFFALCHDVPVVAARLDEVAAERRQFLTALDVGAATGACEAAPADEQLATVGTSEPPLSSSVVGTGVDPVTSRFSETIR